MQSRTVLSSIVLFATISSPHSASADVIVPAIFGDHMVLQQEIKVPVWGKADAGEKITVTVGDHAASTVTGVDGEWRVDLAPFPNGAPATTMTVAGKNTLTFQDVLIGDAWVCSGQSNMEYGMAGCPTDLSQAHDDQLRLFVLTKKMSLEPQTEMGGTWQLCTPDSAKNFSAVGYFFGRELRSHVKRPIGLIGTYWSGSTAQSWTSLFGLEKNPPFKRYIDVYIDDNANFEKFSGHYDEREAAYNVAMQKWNAAGYNVQFGNWLKALSETQKEKKPDPPQTFPPMPNEPPMPGGDQRRPANCYNGMIAPLIPYAIKGVIWYQGEYNVDDPMEYYDLFPRLINDWREKWGQGDFPFLFVQLPTLWLKEWDRVIKSDNWAPLREAQSKALSLPNTGMAVTLDVGGDLHPPGKIFVGQRLALLARNQVYGEASLPDGGPVYTSMKIEGGAIRILFSQKNGDLVIGTSPMADTAAMQPKGKLGGFQIAGADKHWVEADAKIDGASVIVSSPQVPSPVAVRYGWGNGKYDTECNLYDKDGLPASPFRTDDWDDVIPLNTQLSPGMVIKP